MTLFIQNLFLCSAVMSNISLFFMAFNRIFGSRYSAKQRYYSFLVLLLGFLTPFKIKLFEPPVTVNTGGAVQSGSSFGLWELLFFLWFIGFAVCIVCEIMNHARFISSADRLSHEVTDKAILSVSETICAEKGIKKQISLKVFPLISSPMIVGVFEPVLFLPDEYYTLEELELIFEHEYTHLKRYDGIYKVLILLFKSVHWFNPLARVIASAVERECEISCDEEVIKSCEADKKKLYCTIILNSVNKNSKLKTSFSTNFSIGKKALKRRLEEILSVKAKRRIMIIGLLVLCLTVISGTLVGFSSAKADDTLILETTVVTDSVGNAVEATYESTYSPTADEGDYTTTVNASLSGLTAESEIATTYTRAM